MSSILLRNYLKKMYYKSCYYQFNKNYKILIHNPKNKTFKILPLKPHIAINNQITRFQTSKSITIKEYETSRKYTWNWKLERLMGWSLTILIPLAFAIESKELEMLLATAGLMHTYWGCQSMCSDYLRSSNVGKVLPIIVRFAVVVLTFASLAGIYQLIYEDVGLINMIKKFYSIRGRDYVPPKQLQNVDLEEKQNVLRLFFRK
ncbi:succinate dehydrogenase [ubiquinone] cytochrome b small subunit, mitochondrial-like [Lucilia sericata]|uniref:succinate dehydrogenase [ubiquinone] cytochrome b small subunit, mitochondrial-like n=1 Tax=Lucilia sericata TaxID=13632 RepID=UPI0018A88278|nr:succinate dehydrogenase [ubiquinone] cytochrome b small subunit, mitochondrial-like [Lucilia sericata]